MMEKSVCFAIFILGLNILVFVNGAEFRFGENETEPCILLNLDATFSLSYTQDNITQTAPLFDLEGSMVAPNKSVCGTEEYPAVLTVTIFPSHERLTFRFVKDKNNDVTLSVVLDVQPVKHFTDQNSTMEFEMENGVDLYIGPLSKTSYKCMAEQMMIFDRDEPFNMTMFITNLHVQAYNVEGDTFGPVVDCADDTSVGPTIIPITTVSPNVPVYVLRKDNVACIVLKGRLKFTIQYQKMDGETGTTIVSIPENVNVGGYCHAKNTSQEIKLTFFETNWVFSIEIDKLSVTGYGDDEVVDYGWKRISLSYEEDEHFTNAGEPGKRKTVDTDKIPDKFKAAFGGSYRCNSEQNIEIFVDVTLGVSDLQYYAFSETNDTAFSDDDVTKCAADDDDDNNKRTLITVLGSVFGAIAVIIFTIGLVWKIKSRKRVNYQLLAGVTTSMRSDTSMEKRMY